MTVWTNLPDVDRLRARRSRKWISADPDIIGASIAESDFGTAPAVRAALHRAIDEEIFGYQTTDLSAELDASTRRFLADRYQWNLLAGSVRPVADVVRALELAIIRTTPPGGAVAIPTPTYMPFRTLPRAIGRNVVEVPMIVEEGRNALALPALERAFAGGARLLVLCNPHNPTGTVHTREELLALAELVERWDAVVFADEIHAPLTYDNARHVPYASVSAAAAGHTITAHSASKAWNLPGLKCAQLVLTRERDLTGWDQLALEAHGASNLGIIAACAAYDEGRAWLADLIVHLDANRRVLASFITARQPSIKFRPPDGTYLAWLDFRESRLGDPAAALAARSVGIVDGEACGADGAGFCRLNFATPRPVLDDLLLRVGAVLDAAS